jgi:hypothetical protein
MFRKSPRRKPDLFSALVLAVTVGLSLSILYQLRSAQDPGVPPMAEQMRIFVVTSGR